jgi:hypothetical protein
MVGEGGGTGRGRGGMGVGVGAGMRVEWRVRTSCIIDREDVLG